MKYFRGICRDVFPLIGPKNASPKKKKGKRQIARSAEKNGRDKLSPPAATAIEEMIAPTIDKGDDDEERTKPGCKIIISQDSSSVMMTHRRTQSQGCPVTRDESTSNESITSLFYPFATEPGKSNGTFLSVPNSPSHSRQGSDASMLMKTPIKNPSGKKKVPKMILDKGKKKKEAILVDRCPKEIIGGRRGSIYLNGYSVSLDQLQEFHKVVKELVLFCEQ